MPPSPPQGLPHAAADGGPLARFGGVLFRWRSFTPILLLGIAAPLVWRSRGAPGRGPWIAAGVVSSLLGAALRAWVIGQVPDGTSGQNERLIATELNTHGPYAHTRNPLYLGNLLMTLGLCAIAHDGWLVALTALAFAVQYRAIIAAEERFLRERFGAAYDAFCAQVPRFWPRLAAAQTAGAPRAWSGARALKKEHNPIAAWALIALVLLALDQAAVAWRAGSPRDIAGLGLWPYIAALAAVWAVYFAVKAWKHHWLSGGFRADLRRRLREGSR